MRQSSRHSFLLGNKRAFTLIEVLMAIVIGAIAMGIVGVSFFRSHHAMEIVNSQREAYQMVRIVMDRMVKDLSCAYLPSPPPGQDVKPMSEDDISLYRFVGKDDAREDTAMDTLHFTATTDLGLPGSRGGVGEVGYYLKEMEGRKDRFVLVRSEDYLPHYGVSETPREMEMAENILALDIKYVDESAKEVDSWDLVSVLSLPKQVKVTVTFDIEGTPTPFTGTAFLPLSYIKLQKKAEGTQP